jgi:predicted O-methyltransferase YrrM
MFKQDFFRLMNIAAGYRESKILMVSSDLELFSQLSKQPRSIEDLAQQLHVEPYPLTILMNALVAMGFLSKEDGFYQNEAISEKYLVKGSADYVGQFLRQSNLRWNQYGKLADALKPGYAPAQKFSSIEEERNFMQAYIWGLDNLSHNTAAAIAQSLDLNGIRRMLDLGGGAATYSIAFANQNPELTSVLVDLPLALEVARENIQLHGLENRIITMEGSYWKLEFGSEYDLVWLSNIIHGLGESENANLVAKSANALLPGRILVVHDMLFADDNYTSPYHAALFSVQMLAHHGKGRCYTLEEVQQWMLDAGLSNVRRLEIEAGTDLVVGFKP